MTVLILLSACKDEEIAAQTDHFSFTFENSTEGWSAGFADYPIGEEDFYELNFARAPLPQPLDTNTYALRISGSNHSDDLFMFLKHRINGLRPNQVYQLTFDLKLASDVFDGSVGIGGSPANSVFLKAGAVQQEPVPVQQDDYWRMNIDKGQQAQGGADMVVLGDIATDKEDFVYAMIDRDNRGQPFTITTDAEGAVWVVLGTDSGFEGTTTLYYSQIDLEFEPVPEE